MQFIFVSVNGLKESEEDKVTLFDMCSASQANKELICHEVRDFRCVNLCKRLLISTLERADQFCFLYWLASYIKHKKVFVLAICRACSHFSEIAALNCKKFPFNVSREV